MNHSKIRIRPRHAGIDRQHLPERALGIIQPARMQRAFSGFKQLLRITRRPALPTHPTRKKKQHENNAS
jgi:hypothetical protein